MKSPYLLEIVNQYGSELNMVFVCYEDEIREIYETIKRDHETIKLEYSLLSADEYAILKTKRTPRFSQHHENKIEYIKHFFENEKYSPRPYNPQATN